MTAQETEHAAVLLLEEAGKTLLALAAKIELAGFDREELAPHLARVEELFSLLQAIQKNLPP